MSWPATPMPIYTAAILLLPSGMRAARFDLAAPYPPPPHIDQPQGRFHLITQVGAGEIDDIHRALYVLAGHYFPAGLPVDHAALPPPVGSA